MSQLGFLVDQRYCIGCQACQTACQVKNATPVGISLRHAVSFEDIPQGPFVTVSCNHCEEPACFGACSQGAISKDPETGIVLIDAEKCNGCKACVEACPYDAPVIDPATSKALKCDFCKDRLDAGELPACVRACPVTILTYGALDELDKSGVKEAPGFVLEDTKPAIRFIVSA